MTLVKLAWWSGGLWLGCGGLLVGLCILGGLIENAQRGWRGAILAVARELPLILGILPLLGPITLVIAVVVARRDHRVRALQQVCSGPVLAKRAGPLTEAEWQTSADPVAMLTGLPTELGERPARLFAIACCRRIWHRLSDERSRQAIEVAERYAEGRATADDLRDAEAGASAAATLLRLSDPEAGAGAEACHDASSPQVNAGAAAERAAHAHYRALAAERRRQAQLLRDVAGNPFRPLQPRSFPPHVCALARACAEGARDLYPLLADALEDLGEVEAAAHCREPHHVKGCHVVDWALGSR